MAASDLKNLYLKYEIQNGSKKIQINLQDQFGYVLETLTIDLYCLPTKK